MSRPAYPNQLRDHLGNEIRLPPKPFATGGEGAVFDVIGRPDLVAKLYSKAQSKERCDKLQAMARLCSPDLLKLAAWPTATLNSDRSSEILGILMPRISDHKEIHQLYSVAQRKKDFPEADWGFLLHTARNCAIAFENVHSHGHVVGDVNQKNVMVSKKGIVALVDCDSFQVRDGNRIFRCGVGVPEYTPPELHGKKFTDLDRHANHDLFGLAIMIFHLLMMGRHPFAGVPQTDLDIPIEKAIQEGIYAYARNPTKLKPPPHVPAITMLDTNTRELFERAFKSHLRPTATEWRNALDASMKGLQRCKNDSRHSYSAAAGNCPWCQFVATHRLMFFLPGQFSGIGVIRIEQIRQLIQTLTGMQMVFPSYIRPKPTLPVSITLPNGLRNIPKPKMIPSPPSPLFKPRPVLQPLPGAPAIPAAPKHRPYPPAPPETSLPKLHSSPPRPVYPPVLPPEPLDYFLANTCIAFTLVGGVVSLIARPVGILVIIFFGFFWLSLKLTEGIRLEMARKSREREHVTECAQLDEIYNEEIRRIEKVNAKLLDNWRAINTANSVEHAKVCKNIDEENAPTLAPWKAAKSAIEAEHRRVLLDVEQTNRQILSAWESENAALQAAYIEKCHDIETTNQRLLDEWKTVNSPWISEQKRRRDHALSVEAKIKRLEDELIAQRTVNTLKFNRNGGPAIDVIKSHDGTLQDYERELRAAELNSQRMQLDEFLESALICNAKLKGITGGRLLELESFGIESAKDIDILNHQKVPGIGTVLTDRLFGWRTKLECSFRPKPGLPESEKNRIAIRYAPVLRPLIQSLETAISDMKAIEVSHHLQDAERIKRITEAVQELAIAEAYLQAMK